MANLGTAWCLCVWMLPQLVLMIISISQLILIKVIITWVVTILPLKEISSRDLQGKEKGRGLTSKNCIGLMRVGHEILHTCSSAVLDIQKKSMEHLEAEKLKEGINSKSLTQDQTENLTPVKPTPRKHNGSVQLPMQLEIRQRELNCTS